MKTRVEMEDVEKRQHRMSIPTPSRHTFLYIMFARNTVCNRCGKAFATQASVLNHQNQRSSNCWKNYSLLVDVQLEASSSSAEARENAQLSMRSPQPPTPLPMPPSPPMSMMEANAMEIDNVGDQLPEQEATLPSFHTDFFPGASKVFGEGETYMDLFDEDEYANERTANLYHPFASQSEWELASYLLKSDLSMAAINEFLNLQLVSLI
jgi:hypothetical protein